MSGGHYEYQYQAIELLTEQIEREFEKDGIYKSEDWSAEGSKTPLIDADYFEGATKEHREYLLKEIKSLITDLKLISQRAKELEWFMSGDTGIESYIERLKIIYKS